MACNKFLSRSKTTLSCLTHKYVRNNSESFLKLIVKEIPSFKSHQYVAVCHYSTIFSNQRSSNRTCNLFSAIKYSNPVSFMSTSIDNSQYHVVVTDPSQSNASSTDLSPSVSHFSDGSSAAIGSGSSSVATEVPGTFASADLSDIATTLSSELQTATQFVEPSLASLDLCHWTPVGLVQMFLEYLHISWQMPWWIAIVASTVVARILLFPIIVKIQKNATNLANYMPQLQYLQAKFGEARKSGNTMEASRYATEIMHYMKEHDINPVKNALLPLSQAPIYVSFFLGLRGMAKAPVESMQWGGISWVYDLTLPDPYYILPVTACATLYVVLKVGAESGVRFENMKLAKYVLMALPVVALPFTINFPSAILYYWVTTNFCTLAIVSFLKIKPVRRYFKLPDHQPLDPKFVLPNKGFVGGVKEAIEDQKVLAAISDRRRMDEMSFLKSGTGPVPRTYSYDPTKPRPANAAATASQHAVSAKRRKS